MQSWNALLNKQSIRTRLIIWFLLIALIPVAWTTLITYAMSRKILFDQALEHLQSFIFRQEKLITFYFREIRSESKDFIREPSDWKEISQLDDILTQYGKDSVEYQKAAKIFYSNLENRLRYLDYQNLLLVTTTGKVIFSILPFTGIGENLSSSAQDINLIPLIEKTQETLDIEVTSLILNQSQAHFNIYVSIPLLNLNHQLVGIAIAEVSSSTLYRLFSSYNELRQIDNLLVAKIDHSLFAITPTTSQIDQDPKQIVDPNSPFGKFVLQIFNNQQAMTSPIIYDDHTSLMIGSPLKNAFNWVFIGKINQAKLIAPIKKLQYLFWALAITTAFLVILAASNVARKIASPILLLTDKTKILASGDLSQRIEVKSQDEVGRLGQSFNEMASQLDHLISHLDDLVAKRTKEYEIQNIQLEQTIKELHLTRDRLIIQEKLASLGALTAGIAHEIKNPLNFINNFSELCLQFLEDLTEHLHALKTSLPQKEMEEISELAETLKLNISKIYEHGKRADSIVRNMLQHSRGTPGERVSVDIHKLLDEYIALSYHGMRAQNSNFNVKIEKNYDPSITSLAIVPQEISRVFLNLLNNAYYSVQQKNKQRPNDTTYQPTVRISTENHLNSINIKIWDNGLGIAPDVLNKLFTPFFTTKPTGEGTGLGLSLSYNIVVQGHGGTLSAHSQEGEFAEFIITLPSSDLSQK